MQATALGRYLLYGRGMDFPAETASGALGRVTTPGASADFVVRSAASGTFTLRTLGSRKVVSASGADGRLTLVEADAAGDAARFSFVPSTGCQTFPELSTDTDGEPSKGKTPFGAVRGWLDSINHMMAFEFIGGSIHCGRPWSPYGAAIALSDCADHGPNGSTAAVENALSYGDPLHMHTRRRVARLQGLADGAVADPRAGVLEVARARLARRTAADGRRRGRQRAALRAVPAHVVTRATRWR